MTKPFVALATSNARILIPDVYDTTLNPLTK